MKWSLDVPQSWMSIGLAPTDRSRPRTDRLSHGQLRELAGLPKAPHAHSLDQLLYRLRALDDAEIVRVTSKAALACEIDHVL